MSSASGHRKDFVFVIDKEDKWRTVELWDVLLTLPALHNAEVLNAGQGEGQFSLDGQEWGLYYARSGRAELVAHQPTISLARAEAIFAEVISQLEDTLNSQ